MTAVIVMILIICACSGDRPAPNRPARGRDRSGRRVRGSSCHLGHDGGATASRRKPHFFKDLKRQWRPPCHRAARQGVEGKGLVKGERPNGRDGPEGLSRVKAGQ